MKLNYNSRLMNRPIANKLIRNLFSYLSYYYLNFYFCPPQYLVLYQYQQLSCSILSFVSVNSFVNYNIRFFVSCNIPFFVSTNGFISCSVQYWLFLFIANYLTKFISYPNSLLDHLVGPKLSRSFYFYRASQISHYTMRVNP